MISRHSATRRRGTARWAAVVAVAVLAVTAGAAGATSGTSTHPAATPTAAQRLAAQVKAAVARTAYPAVLSPKPGDPAGTVKYLLPPYQCINPDDILNTDQCNFGPADAPHSAVVMGDSISVSLLPAVLDDLLPRGYRVHGIALSACPNANVRVAFSFSPSAAARCNRSHELLYAQVQRLDPDLLILTDSASEMQRLASGNRGAAAVTEWLAGERSALQQLRAPGRRIVVLAPNPTSADPRTCYTAHSSPQDCLYTIDTWWFGKVSAESRAAQEYGATYVNTQSWFADGKRVPIFAGQTTQRWDASHLTTSYSHKVAPALLDALRSSLATS